MATNPDRRLEVDAVLWCARCRQAPYKVFRRQNQQPDGTLLSSFQHEIWPASPDVPPPVHPEDIRCPRCGGSLRRAAP